MINTDQLNRIIDSDDDMLNCAIELATRDHDDLLAILTDPESLAKLAWEFDTSPATIARFAEHLTNAGNYARFCFNYEICPIHRIDAAICESDDLHPYSAY